MTETFFAWRRPAITALAAADTFQHGRLVGTLQVSLNDEQPDTVPGSADFLFAGPADVGGLQPGLVIGRKPAPGTMDAEVTRVAHIELSDDGLPWRYSPQHNTPAGIQPWLVLVVGITGVEIFLDGPRVRILKAALKEHPLIQSAGWAHVHELPGHPIARILSPRQLSPGCTFTAALVPAYAAGDGVNGPKEAWASTTEEVTLACYDAWQFSTVDRKDDFAIIAGRLAPLSTPEQQALDAAGFGRAAVGVRADDPAPIHLHGALGVVPGPLDPPLDDLAADVADRVETLAELSEQAGRWVLGLPRYDEPWTAPGTPVPAAGWRRQLRFDPRARGSAGLGAWAAISWQDRIGDGAARQAGSLALLAERVRHLGLGLRGSRSQWTRRMPADPVAGLAVVGPMLARIPTGPGRTILDEMNGRTSRLVPALFSSAARRMLRPGTALQRVAAPGATSMSALIDAAATRCAPKPPPLKGQEDLPGLVADQARREEARIALAREAGLFLQEARKQMTPNAREDVGDVAEIFDTFGDQLIGELVRPEVPDDCQPVTDLGALAGSVLDGISPLVPRPVVVGRVLDGFTGIRQPELAEPDLALELNIPLWSFLRDSSPDWLLPGGGAVPNDRVLALQTNPDFVDAFLVGANQRALGELRWRNIPLVTGWTPLRRFWQRIGNDGSGPTTDIRPVLNILTLPSPGQPTWLDASELGDSGHQSDGVGPRLVILLHTELFRRYPSTLVYLLANPGGADDWTGKVEDINTAPVWPNLNGSLNPELVFFGFPKSPDAAQDHWLVLEEPPPGFRFKVPTDDQRLIIDASAYAAATLNPPIRAFFGNLL